MFTAADYDIDMDQYPQMLDGMMPSISDLPEVSADYDNGQGLYQTTGVYMMKQEEPEQFIEKGKRKSILFFNSLDN